MAAPGVVSKWALSVSFAKQIINRCRFSNASIVCLSTYKDDTSNTSLRERDPFPLYSSTEVQTVLRKMTGFDLMKVAGPQKKPLERPVYKLLTDEELSQDQERTRLRVSQRLEMPPPYMNPKKPVKEPLAVDPDLAHFDSSKYVFTDISFGLKDRERSVVVREVDGTLWEAPGDVKERMNQLYNPRPGRSIIKPKMFEDNHIERLLSEKRFIYILDRACAQFEPDDPDFLRVCHRVYTAVNAYQQFDILRSTRFFAPMAFHLIWTKTIDSLLMDMLVKDLISDATDLVELYCLVHPNGACAQRLKIMDKKDTQSIIQIFMETEAGMASEIELVLQSVMDRSRNRSESPGSSHS